MAVRNRFITGAFFLLMAMIVQPAYSSGGDETEESASLLCKLLDGMDALTQASEFSVEHRTVNIVIDGSSEDARNLCPEISAMVEEQALVFSEGWVVEIVSSKPDYQVIGTCPLL
ncbi:hypothetical protein LOY67_18615 [Pseudomonas sp. B21-056]|uniref:hypothetical protein n=1 Tax=Pseudomonas sp. B21-056 TaxID=2895495 RepID=UPI00222EDA87|nr:hypothetical protein [Pseudomonas sp. B21-056]UZE22058.1 hypothetical protein LOY67_18615 [Pseudomonas sp. B21-056]